MTTTLKELIQKHKGQFIGVTFTKLNGEERTINGQHCYKQGHDGVNTVAHIEKYITISENLGGGGSQFRNVNTETIKRIAVGGKVYTF